MQLSNSALLGNTEVMKKQKITYLAVL